MQRSKGVGYCVVVSGLAFAVAAAGCSAPQATSPKPKETTSAAPTETTDSKTSVELTDGHLTIEIPESWNADIQDMTETIMADGSAPEFNGYTAHQATITNLDETVAVDVFTNVPWPDVAAIDPNEVELLHAEPLDIGYVGEGSEPIWLRAVIGENPSVQGRPHFGMFDGRFDDEQYLLVVAPYVSKAELGEPEEIGGGMSAFITPYSVSTAGQWWEEVITIAAGTINQNGAEKLTGLEGLEAMQALVETEEYEQLLNVIRSFKVHVNE